MSTKFYVIGNYRVSFINKSNFVQFNHKVLKVSRIEGRWIVEVLKMETDWIHKYEFDGVMICNGSILYFR